MAATGADTKAAHVHTMMVNETIDTIDTIDIDQYTKNRYATGVPFF